MYFIKLLCTLILYYVTCLHLYLVFCAAYKEFTGSAQITFREPQLAEAAVTKFDNTQFNSQVINVRKTSSERHNQTFIDTKSAITNNKRSQPDNIDNDDSSKLKVSKKRKLKCDTINENSTASPAIQAACNNEDSAASAATQTACDKENFTASAATQAACDKENSIKRPLEEVTDSDNSDDEPPLKEYHQEQLGRVLVKDIPCVVCCSLTFLCVVCCLIFLCVECCSLIFPCVVCCNLTFLCVVCCGLSFPCMVCCCLAFPCVVCCGLTFMHSLHNVNIEYFS